MTDKSATKKVINVTVRRELSSQGQTFRALNTYQKGGLFCIYLENGGVKKIPMSAIFDIDEDYAPVVD
jgi:hypothetical protein